MPAKIEYKKGDKLGPYNIEFIEEVEPYICPSGTKSRKGKFICPECGTFFETRIDRIKSGNTRSCGCIQEKTRIENGKNTGKKYGKINGKKYGKINGKKNGKERFKDLTDKRFGKLVVLEKTEKRNNSGNIIWKCKCDCGKITYVAGGHLTDESTRSCGCIQRKRAKELGKKNCKNLIGRRFGKLVVLEKTKKRSGNNIIWKCKCDCGKITYVAGGHLTDESTRSCGCNRESRGEEKIRVFLQSLNINFKTQKTFNDCINPETNAKLRLDFYLPDYNCCIEYDGQQHFIEVEAWGGQEKLKKQQTLDDIKNQYCKENNIKLIRIPYWDYNNIEEILTKELNL